MPKRTPPWIRNRNRQRFLATIATLFALLVVSGLLVAAHYKAANDTSASNPRIADAGRQRSTTALTAPEASDGAIPYGSSCGVEMWAKKVLMLPGDAALPATPVQASIERLTRLDAPADPDALADRVHNVEDREWSVQAILLGVKLESDSDYHLVLADPDNPNVTMIAEIPASYCTSSSRAAAFATARRSVDSIAHHRANNRFWWLDRHGTRNAPLVIVDGYGFFDRVTGHREVGGAPSGIEIHPVISVQLAAP